MNYIYGWWNINGQPIPLEKWMGIKEVSSLDTSDTISTFFDKEIAFSHHQIDINSKEIEINNQESVYTEAECTITADSRLDNREDLLQQLHVSENNLSDAQIILKTYIKYGEQCINYFIGAFAFAIWNNNKEEIFCATDHIGIKPFYYTFEGKRFIFGSQKKSILSLPFVNKKADWYYIVHKLENTVLPVDDRTENLSIKKLLPAHVLKINRKDIHTYRYWNFDIQTEIRYKNDQDYIDHFKFLFEQSIQNRMRGSSAISAHLSGGLDSSGVAGMASIVAKKEQKQFHSFSYTFPRNEKFKTPPGIYNFNTLVDEQVAFSSINQAHYVSTPAPFIFKDRVHLEARLCDGISCSNNVNTEYEILLAAQQHKIGINLSGFLGDEIISSFVRPYYLEYLEKGNYIKFFKSKHKGKSFKKQQLILLGLHLLHKFNIPYNETYVAQKYQAYRSANHKGLYIEDSHLFSKKFLDQHTDIKKALQNKDLPTIHQSIPLSLKAYQRNHINRFWTTRRITSENDAAKAFRMEYRYPMSDIRLLQYVLSLPVEQKRNDQYSRLLYRRALKDIVPESIRWRHKFMTYLKPLAHYRKTVNDHSIIQFWEAAKKNNITSFLDEDMINNNLKYNRDLHKFYKYAIILDLIQKNKLTI